MIGFVGSGRNANGIQEKKTAHGVIRPRNSPVSRLNIKLQSNDKRKYTDCARPVSRNGNRPLPLPEKMGVVFRSSKAERPPESAAGILPAQGFAKRSPPSSINQPERPDNWITQAVFRKPNRRKVNLAHVGTCFVDLDYYNTEHGYCEPELIRDLVLQHCESMKIPFPSLVIDSGRGLQVKWYHNPLPRQALPRWDAVQKHLNEQFRALGADTKARDASRVLRVVRTVNKRTDYPPGLSG